MRADPIRIAIIGCGAVSELLHLPALADRAEVDTTLLVDKNETRARELAEKYKVPNHAPAWNKHSEEFDAAIIALPHFLHASVTEELLDAGKHVLVEKPMALSTAECDTMISAAAQSKATLTVGQMRRFCPAVAMAKTLVERNLIGEVRNFAVHDGVVFAWPVASDFQFRKESAGGGVLVDAGAHALDMVIALLGTPEVTAYRDDAAGGVEADCEIDLRLPNGATGFVELSRTRELKNSIRIEGTLGALEVFFYQNQFRIEGLNPQQAYPVIAAPDAELTPDMAIWPLMIRLQLADWIESISDERPPQVSGEEGRKVVNLIECCYATKTPLRFPWVKQSASLSQ
ncbi:MAG: Gfo/Idh/MocA family oxidoreductase [Verrucomicrobiota bacterium]